MARRARWLIILHTLIPGSAQLVAGNRRFARIGIIGTLTIWALLILAGVLYFINRTWLFWVVTNPILSGVGAALAIAWAVLYFALSIDTIRLIRLVRLPHRSRRVALVASLLVTALGTSAFGYAGNVAISQTSLVGAVFNQTGGLTPVDGQYNILLLGGDAGPDRFGLRPDSISVLSINAETGDTVNIGVPRNLQRVSFVKGSPMLKYYPNGWDCGVECLLNAIYKTTIDNHPKAYPNAIKDGSDPGVEATKDAVEYVTGLQIQAYVMVDMYAFRKLIDALGGVTINVKERLPIGGDEDAYGQPINVKGWIEPGLQHMSGYRALWYARARHGSNDFVRMGRQREVERALLAQLEPVNVLARFNELSKAGRLLIRTDIPSDMLPVFLDLAIKAKAKGLGSLELVPPTISTIYPNFKQIHKLVQRAIHPAPTPAATQ